MKNCREGLTIVALAVTLVYTGLAQIADKEDAGKLRRSELARYGSLQKAQWRESGSGQNIDVTSYELRLQLFPSTQNISGSVRIGAKTTVSSASSVQLDLQSSHTIDSVLVDGVQVSVTRGTSTFAVPLSPPRPLGSPLVIDVFYHGQPFNSGFGSFAFSAQPNTSIPWIWSLSEPYGAPDWWPCKDNPADKADSLDVWITCDQAFKAGSEGKLVSVTSPSPGLATYHWKHRHPISTYLVSLAVTDYASFSNWFKYSATDSMEVLNYVLPASLATAQILLPFTVDMLQIYSDLYGLYPFIDEKYGHSQFGWGGGMEHQTMTSVGGFGESLIAHELAHQWFGDMITLKTWPDVWLNEGFATYSVALYLEKKYGMASYWNYMDPELQSARNAVGTVHVQDTTNLGQLFDGDRVYSKGASVLHMLRHVVGDSLFFAAMKAYAADNRLRFGNASTEDFQGVVEQVSGKNLAYFFQEWIYGEGYPRYTYTWTWVPESDGGHLDLNLKQSTLTSSPTFFTMPIDIRISGAWGDTTIVIFNDSAAQSWSWQLPFQPASVALDPDNWILKSSTELRGVATTYVLGQNFPNPFNPSTKIHYFVPQRSKVKVEVLNLLGQSVELLEEVDRDAGEYEVTWKPRLSSGVYFCRMKASPLDNPSNVSTRIIKMLYVK